MVEEIIAFRFTYTPWDKTFPIRSCELTIYAKSKTEAEMVALRHADKFFEQDHSVVIEETARGYRQIPNGEKK